MISVYLLLDLDWGWETLVGYYSVQMFSHASFVCAPFSGFTNAGCLGVIPSHFFISPYSHSSFKAATEVPFMSFSLFHMFLYQ